MTDMQPAPRPTNVIEALARVMGEIGGIERLNPAQRAQRGMGGGGAGTGIDYAYRGIDQITQAAVPLFAEYGIVVVPLVTEHERRDGLGKNGNMLEHIIRCHWRVYGPGGVTDCIEAATVGESRDSGDKGANKAQTAAFKNLLLRVLCITDPADDTDNYKTAEDGPSHAGQTRPTGTAPPASQDEWTAALATLKPPQKQKLMRYASQTLGIRNFNEPGEMTGEMMQALRNVVDGREPHEGPPVAPAEPDAPEIDEQEAEPATAPPAEEPGAGGDPPNAPAPEPPKTRTRSKPEPPKPVEEIAPHDCDWTATRSTCTICGNEEPF